MFYSFRKSANEFIFRFFYRQLFRNIESITRDCQSILDLGCGCKPFMTKVTSRMKTSVGVDLHEPSLKKAKELNTHHSFVKSDVISYLKSAPDSSFDAVMALDLIEHLEKEEGLDLLKEMERVASKKAILFTPNGFVPQSSYDNNPWQVHKSGWGYEEMKEKGYSIIGIAGHKSIRGERALIYRKPRFFWKLLSHGSQLFTYHLPRYAFALLCVKTLSRP